MHSTSKISVPAETSPAAQSKARHRGDRPGSINVHSLINGQRPQHRRAAPDPNWLTQVMAKVES